MAILGCLACQTDWPRVGEAFARLNWSYWLLGVGLYAATQVISSVRWRMLSIPMGFQRPLGQYVAIYFIGMFFNLLLPTSVGGDVVRAWYLDGRSGRRSLALVSVVLDRGSGLLALLALGCIAALAAPQNLPRGVAPLIAGLAGAAVFVLILLPVLMRSGRRFTRLQPLLLAARAYLRQPGVVISTTALSVVIQVANVVLVWLIGEAMGLEIPTLYYGVLVPVVTLLTLLPISLNGMGVREGATVFLLMPLGIPPALAVGLAFLWFATFTVTSLAGVGFYLWGQFPRVEVRDDGPLGHHSDQGRTRQSAAAA